MKYLIDIRNELIRSFNKLLAEMSDQQKRKKNTRLTIYAKQLIHSMAELCRDTNIYIETKEVRQEFIESIKKDKQLLDGNKLFIIVLQKIMDAPSDTARLVCMVWIIPVLDEVIRGKIKRKNK